MDNGGIFSMFPLSKRNFRTTSYDGNTIKVDKFRGDHVLLHKVLVLYCTVLYCTVLYCTDFYASLHIFLVLSDPKTVQNFWHFCGSVAILRGCPCLFLQKILGGKTCLIIRENPKGLAS